MDKLAIHQKNILNDGYTVIENIYTDYEISNLISEINNADQSNSNFRQTDDLFAIRQFIRQIPGVASIIFNNKLKSLIQEIFGEEYFVVKSIYFDKPEQSNWFVAYHQDLTISVDKKSDIAGYSAWTNKQGQFAVQPPIEILEDNFTIRIHLDDTNKYNGALKVVPESHSRKIIRLDNINTESEVICNVNKGGVMIMRPLLLHASNRTVNNERRRVIHIEFSRSELATEIKWSEKLPVS